MLAVFNVLHISHRINLLEISCVFPCNEQMVEKRLWGEGGNIVNNTSCDSLYLNNLESKRVNSKSTLIQRTPMIIILNTTEKDVVQWMTRKYSGKKLWVVLRWFEPTTFRLVLRMLYFWAVRDLWLKLGR